MIPDFWWYIQHLTDSCEIVIDRPRGTVHPRFPEISYPVDYGYLKGTSSLDLGGVDIWVGSMGAHKVTGVLCTVDLLKKDTELKIVFDCTAQEIQAILNLVNFDQMRAIYIKCGDTGGMRDDVDT